MITTQKKVTEHLNAGPLAVKSSKLPTSTSWDLHMGKYNTQKKKKKTVLICCFFLHAVLLSLVDVCRSIPSCHFHLSSCPLSSRRPPFAGPFVNLMGIISAFWLMALNAGQIGAGGRAATGISNQTPSSHLFSPNTPSLNESLNWLFLFSPTNGKERNNVDNSRPISFTAMRQSVNFSSINTKWTQWPSNVSSHLIATINKQTSEDVDDGECKCKSHQNKQVVSKHGNSVSCLMLYLCLLVF